MRDRPGMPTLSKPYRWPSSRIDVCHSLRSTLAGPCDVHTSSTAELVAVRLAGANSTLPWFSPEETKTCPGHGQRRGDVAVEVGLVGIPPQQRAPLSGDEADRRAAGERHDLLLAADFSKAGDE